MNICKHLSSENRKPNAFRPKKSISATGIVTASVQTIPAVTAACLPRTSFCAALFAISRDTVTGTPLEAAVRNTAKTVRQIW